MFRYAILALAFLVGQSSGAEPVKKKEAACTCSVTGICTCGDDCQCVQLVGIFGNRRSIVQSDSACAGGNCAKPTAVKVQVATPKTGVKVEVGNAPPVIVQTVEPPRLMTSSRTVSKVKHRQGFFHRRHHH